MNDLLQLIMILVLTKYFMSCLRFIVVIKMTFIDPKIYTSILEFLVMTYFVINP